MSIKPGLFTHFLLLTTLLSLGLCYCEGHFDGSYSPCTFYFGYQDSNCSLYQFGQCSWVECVSYVTVGNDTQCVAYQTFYDSNWASCSNRCCYGQFPNEYASLQKCEDNAKKVTILILTIIFSVIGGIIGIIVIICLICKFRDNLSSCCSSVRDCFRAFGEGLCYILTCGCLRSLTFRPNYAQNIELSVEGLSKWTAESVTNERLNESCCICLEPSPNLQLECGHIYHRTCILSYLAKKEECALCRSTNVQRVKVYCEICFHRSCMFNIQGSQEQLKIFQPICDLCKQAKL